MKNYELALILKDDEQVNDYLEKIRNLLKQNNVSVVEEDVWGRRDLAYKIKHNKTGYYVILKINAEPSIIENLNKQLLLEDFLLRHLFVRS